MKLATLKSTDSKNRNGKLVVVSKDNTKAVDAESIAPTLLDALETWKDSAPKLRALYERLNAGNAPGIFKLNLADCLAPVPNAPGFYDGSAFLSHVVRARRARGDQMPESAKKTPLMYQGVSDNQLAWNSPLDLMDVGYGGDFEAEYAVITTDVPKGVSGADAGSYIALVTLFNDITYREIVKTEIETKFGFLQSKPNSAYAPIVVTPDELGGAWKNGRVELDVSVCLNNQTFGNPNGREMHFSFGELIAHAARTRPLSAGCIVGSGTVSNEDKARGFACLTEKRFQEILDNGKPSTPWLQPGDRVTIDVTHGGTSVFGAIEQTASV